MVMTENEPINFWYRNHRGIGGFRRARFIDLRWGVSEWHKEPQWLVRAFDVDKQAEREFAIKDMRPVP